MGFTGRNDFSGGWQPDVDAAGALPNVLLRADNLVLDELGVVALRRDRAFLFNLGPTLDVHSLYTEVLNGTKYRFAGADNVIYVDGGVTGRVDSVGGRGDVAFGGHQGQVLMARADTRVKFDGSLFRNWGILPPTGTLQKPTITAGTPDYKVFAIGSLAAAEFVINEDDGTGIGYAQDHAGVANGATVLHPNGTTGRGTMSDTYAGPTNFTVYIGLTEADDGDIISFYVYVTDPAKLASISLLIDVNQGDYQTDYYFWQWLSGQTNPVGQTVDTQQVFDVADASAQPAQINDASAGGSVAQVFNVGWNQLKITRGQLQRIGNTNGKGWTTVKAIRFAVQAYSTDLLKFDTVRISGARLQGEYEWVYQLAFNSDTYVGLSSPSLPSVRTTISSDAAKVTLPIDITRDPYANEIWVFRRGGNLPDFLRVATQDLTPGVTTAIDINDTLSDVNALIENIPLEFDDVRPPENIIDIEGPYFDRIFVLTSDGMLWPSRQLNPDSFATGQAIRICAADETAFWVKKGIGGLYVGTSKDIYRLEGDGTELPDGSINFTKRPINVDHPPINDGIAQEGNLLVYVANDGWRAFTGETTQSIIGATSLLYRGYTRHGVSPVNLATGRFRACIVKGQLTTITPEGASDVASNVVYRHAPARGGWYRFVYPSSFKVIYAERDGTILAADTAGIVWQLDTAPDANTSIPVELWTSADDLGNPFNRKDPSDYHLTIDTGGTGVTIQLCTDGGAPPAYQTGVSAIGMRLNILSALGVGRFRQLQTRLLGTMKTFRLQSWGVTYVTRPIGIRSFDSGPLNIQRKDLAWIRRAWVSVNAYAPLTVIFILDGVLIVSQTTDVTGEQDVVLPIALPKGTVGRQPRVLITSTDEFLPQWIEIQFRESGKGSQKQTIRIPVAA